MGPGRFPTFLAPGPGPGQQGPQGCLAPGTCLHPDGAVALGPQNRKRAHKEPPPFGRERRLQTCPPDLRQASSTGPEFLSDESTVRPGPESPGEEGLGSPGRSPVLCHGPRDWAPPPPAIHTLPSSQRDRPLRPYVRQGRPHVPEPRTHRSPPETSVWAPMGGLSPAPVNVCCGWFLPTPPRSGECALSQRNTPEKGSHEPQVTQPGQGKAGMGTGMGTGSTRPQSLCSPFPHRLPRPSLCSSRASVSSPSVLSLGLCCLPKSARSCLWLPFAMSLSMSLSVLMFLSLYIRIFVFLSPSWSPLPSAGISRPGPGMAPTLPPAELGQRG